MSRLNVIVKNTFIDLDDADQEIKEGATRRRRSSSVPRAWRLRTPRGSDKQSRGTLSNACRGSDEQSLSTSASDCALSDISSGMDSGRPSGADLLLGVSSPRGGLAALDAMWATESTPVVVGEDFHDRLRAAAAASPSASGGLYMQWDGRIKDMPDLSARFGQDRRHRLNPAAEEFKMPFPTAPAGETAEAVPEPFVEVQPFMVQQQQVCDAQVAAGCDAAQFYDPQVYGMQGAFAETPMQTAEVCGDGVPAHAFDAEGHATSSGSRLNPQAEAFQPGVPAFGGGSAAADAEACDAVCGNPAEGEVASCSDAAATPSTPAARRRELAAAEEDGEQTSGRGGRDRQHSAGEEHGQGNGKFAGAHWRSQGQHGHWGRRSRHGVARRWEVAS